MSLDQLQTPHGKQNNVKIQLSPPFIPNFNPENQTVSELTGSK
jgi:hypothetical protein